MDITLSYVSNSSKKEKQTKLKTLKLKVKVLNISQVLGSFYPAFKLSFIPESFHDNISPKTDVGFNQD